MTAFINTCNDNSLRNSSIKKIKMLYKKNNIPWVIGYSGGKDSTVVAQLIFEALNDLEPSELTKLVYIISSDTLVETPPVIGLISSNLKKMQHTANKNNLPIRTHLVKPLPNQSFWANIIGRGYPSPNQTFRWCTDRMKIDPANRFIKETVSEHGEVIMVLGIRDGESQSRDRVMQNHDIEGKDLMRHSTLQNAYIFAPIRPFTVDDVWEYLLNQDSPWGGDNYELYDLYRDSNSTECPLVIDEEIKEQAGSCGNSRFGCWTCTVVTEDKALSGFINKGEEWLRPLLKFRNWLSEIRDDRTMRMKRRTSGGIYFSPVVKINDSRIIIPKKSKREQIIIEKQASEWIDEDKNQWNIFNSKKDAENYIKKSNIDLDSSYDPRIIAKLDDENYGQLGLGPFTIESRKMILKKLLEVQKRLDKDFQLITKEELFEIRKLWLANGDFNDSVRSIYEEIMQEPIEWESDDLPLFNENQLEDLRKLCEKYEVNFNLYKQLINVERKYLGNIVRNKPIKEMERLLTMDFLHVGE